MLFSVASSTEEHSAAPRRPPAKRASYELHNFRRSELTTIQSSELLNSTTSDIAMLRTEELLKFLPFELLNLRTCDVQIFRTHELCNFRTSYLNHREIFLADS